MRLLTPPQAIESFWRGVAAPSQIVLAAVSGGPDSLALLNALLASRANYPGLKLEVAHLNHSIRGKSAEADALFVADFCQQFDVPCHLGEFDVPTFAAQAGLSPEDAARRVRYAFLRQLAAEREVTLVLTGHTADDQAETVLLRLLRGTGPHGLSGMTILAPLPPLDPLLKEAFPLATSAQARLGRPMLKVWRREIMAYCTEQKLNPRHDETNDLPIYSRNRLRFDLLPYLETHYQPHIKSHLTRLAELTRADQEWLDGLVEVEFRANARVQAGPSRAVSFDPAYWASRPIALQRRLIRRAILALHDLQNLDAAHIEAVLELFLAATPGRLHLPGGLQAFRLKTELGIAELAQTREEWPPEGFFELAVPGELVGPGQAWRLEVSLRDATNTRADTITSTQQPDRFRARLDYDKIGSVLRVRPRREGERYRPLGAPGRRKVQDIMAEAQLRRELRADWPLVVRPGEPEAICWIPGAAIAHEFRITETTSNILDFGFSPLRVQVILD